MLKRLDGLGCWVCETGFHQGFTWVVGFRLGFAWVVGFVKQVRCWVCETGGRLADPFREHKGDAEQNNTDASKPVARHFSLPNHSHHAQHDYLRAILTPREHRKPQNSRTKINFSTGYTLSTRNQWTLLIPLIYSQIHVTISSPMAMLLYTLI